MRGDGCILMMGGDWALLVCIRVLHSCYERAMCAFMEVVHAILLPEKLAFMIPCLPFLALLLAT